MIAGSIERKRLDFPKSESDRLAHNLIVPHSVYVGVRSCPLLSVYIKIVLVGVSDLGLVFQRFSLCLEFSNRIFVYPDPSIELDGLKPTTTDPAPDGFHAHAEILSDLDD